MRLLKEFLIIMIIIFTFVGCSKAEDVEEELKLTKIEKFIENKVEFDENLDDESEKIEDSITLINETASIEYGNEFNPLEYISEEDRKKDIKISNPVSINSSGIYFVSYTFGEVTKELQVTVMEKPEVAKIEVQVVSLTSPIDPGQNATIQIKGTPNTIYSINVYYKSGASKSNDLYAKESDSDGFVEWTWQVGSRTSAGNWKITIESEIDSISTNFTVN